MKLCAIILNRNLPKVTDQLYKNLKKHNKRIDIFVVEAGSDEKNLSKYTTWHANWEDAKKNGLRYGRGFNFALSNLYKEKKFGNYDAYILLTNDTYLKNYKIENKIAQIFKKHKKLAILSPCSNNWGEKKIINNIEKLKYFWYIHNNAYIIKTSFLDEIKNLDQPGHINFIFDGNNFRGYGLESELIMKAYANDKAAAITTDIIAEENENYLLKFSKEIKTEDYDKNLDLYVKEGMDWMQKKYGFRSKWSMQMFVKVFYDKFFITNNSLKKYKL